MIHYQIYQPNQQVPLRALQDHALRAAAADAPLQEEVPHLVLRGQAKDTGNSVTALD